MQLFFMSASVEFREAGQIQGLSHLQAWTQQSALDGGGQAELQCVDNPTGIVLAFPRQ